MRVSSGSLLVRRAEGPLARQSLQDAPKEAWPAPSLLRRSGRSCPAGQLTVFAVTSIVNASWEYIPSRTDGGCTFTFGSIAVRSISKDLAGRLGGRRGQDGEFVPRQRVDECLTRGFVVPVACRFSGSLVRIVALEHASQFGRQRRVGDVEKRPKRVRAWPGQRAGMAIGLSCVHDSGAALGRRRARSFLSQGGGFSAQLWRGSRRAPSKLSGILW